MWDPRPKEMYMHSRVRCKKGDLRKIREFFPLLKALLLTYPSFFSISPCSCSIPHPLLSIPTGSLHAAASHRLPRHASASPSALPPQASHLLVNCAQSLQSIHHLTKAQSLDLPVLPAWPQLPKHQSSRPLQGKGKLCERLNCYFCCCIVCTNVTMM